jgi:hypothetical protein
MQHELDGRALQEAWDREGILVESWDEKNAGNMRPAFSAIKGKGWLYVKAEGTTPQLYRDPAELVDGYRTLTEPERAMYAEWLAALEACAAEACRTAEQRPG